MLSWPVYILDLLRSIVQCSKMLPIQPLLKLKVHTMYTKCLEHFFHIQTSSKEHSDCITHLLCIVYWAIFPFLEPGAAWYLMQSIVLRASLVAPHQSTTTSSVYSQEISVALRLGWVVLNSLLALNSSESIAKRAVQWCWCRLRRKFFSTSNFSVCFYKSAASLLLFF